MYKKSMQCTLCVEFQQVQYIHLSELIHILKGVTIVSSEHFLWPVTFWLLIRCPLKGG